MSEMTDMDREKAIRILLGGPAELPDVRLTLVWREMGVVLKRSRVVCEPHATIAELRDIVEREFAILRASPARPPTAASAARS